MPIDFMISLTKIYVHTKQAKFVNALLHKYEDIRPNSHVIYTKKAIKIFEDFSIFLVFEFLNTLKNRTSKVRSIKTSTTHNLKIMPSKQNTQNKIVCALQKIKSSKIKRWSTHHT